MNIQAEHGKLSVSEIARLYDKDRKSIYTLIQSHSISAERQESPKRTLVSLADIISHWGEPAKSPEPHSTVGIPRDPTPTSTKNTPNATPDKYVALLEKHNEELKFALAEEKSEKRELKKQINELYIESLRVNKLLLEDSRKGFWKRLFT